MTAIQAIEKSKANQATVRVRCGCKSDVLFVGLLTACEAGQGCHVHDGEGGHSFEGFDWKVVCDVGADWRAVHAADERGL